ncbi:MAG: response regulator transcription factor [Corynebacterium provencense]|jgi:DNA-binding NarL/FixJ family response regulator|uniref:response regulator transcription factor n=1 Tax=Corynebacterium provencense TaxID=1737425 RepID=UPI002989D899|nr:response regulator transcription factor [Corynebacterium provencense]
MTGTTTVGLADDQQLVRAGFAMVLDSQDDITVAWQAVDGRDAVRAAREHPVDILLMDVQMPDMDGITATRLIIDGRVAGPSGAPTRVVMLTTFDNDEYVMDSVTAGASGFLLKDADPEDLIAAVRTVGESSAVISPKATARLLRRVREDSAGVPASPSRQVVRVPDEDDSLGLVDPLTPREREILVLMARGASNTEVAAQLFVSLPTVKTHVGRILAKTGSRDRVHAVLFAFRHGLVDPVNLLDG